MGLLDKIGTLTEREPRKSEGLLKRSLETLARRADSPLTPSTRRIPTTENQESATHPIEELEPSIDAPLLFLPILCSHLACERAALLLAAEGSKSPVPCAVVGWKESVLHGLDELSDRMLDLVEAGADSPVSPGSIIPVPAAITAEWEPVLTADGSDGPQQLHLVPVFDHGKTMAVILIAGAVDSDLKAAKELVSTKARQLILGRLEVLEQTAGYFPAGQDELERIVVKTGSGAGSNGPVQPFYRISPERLVSGFRSEGRLLPDPYILRKDLMHVLGYVLRQLGKLYLFGSSCVLIPSRGHASYETDAELLSHQIEVSLKNFFHSTHRSMRPPVEEIGPMDIGGEPGKG